MSPGTYDKLELNRWEAEGGALAPDQEAALSSLNPKKPLFGRSIYRVLANHQTHEEWDCRPLVQELQVWAERMNEQFRLRIPEVSLSVDWLRCRRLGHFRPGHNGFGLKGEIAINRRHLEDRDFWQVLGTLLHELLHAWQQEHGKAGKHNYHNKEFREKAREFGLSVDRRGYTDYEPHSPLMELLSQYGVNAPEFPPRGLVRLAAQGSSKLKPWVCACMRIWVAVADCQSVCLKCGQLYERAR
ncbi:MAG: SprT-like domain-containing protein [Pirellulales bacterium]